MNIKRVALLIATNLGVMLVLSLTASLLGVNRFLTSNGLNLSSLLVFAMIMGFGGSFISLMMSKTMAKWSTGAQIIDTPQNEAEAWIVSVVARHAHNAGIAMPEVAVYDGPANAFATGPSRVMLSSKPVETATSELSREEVEAVIAHEVAHVANGDMVTLTLIQGVVNTFVIFLARVVGYVVDGMFRRDNEQSGPGMAYMVTVMVCEIAFGIVASMIVMYYSREREFRADAGAAQLMGSPMPMVAALRRLGGISDNDLPKEMQAMGIAGGASALFATHPSLEDRIAALQGHY